MNAGWQRGRSAWGSLGLFPLSCVKELELSGRSRQLSERSAAAKDSELPPYALGRACALMSLHAQLDEELDFREGDIITIVGVPEPGWFQGELDGRRGVFPEGFVELLAPLRSLQASETVGLRTSRRYPYSVEEEDELETTDGQIVTGTVDVELEHQESDEEAGGIYGIALYDFRALEAEELDFNAGDKIQILKTLDDGWLEGRVRSRTGIFPHRFVKLEALLEAPVPSAMTEPEASEKEDHDVYISQHSPGQPDHKNFKSYSQESACHAIHQDHTVWDLDYFERREKNKDDSLRSTRSKDGIRVQNMSGPKKQERPPPPLIQSSRTGNSTPKPLQRTSSGSPTPPRPKLPPRPSVHSISNRQNTVTGTSSTAPKPPPVPDSKSQSLKNTTTSGLENASSSVRNGVLYASHDRRNPFTSRGLEAKNKQKTLTRHASANDVDYVRTDRSVWHRERSSTCHRPSSLTGDLDNKLVQQLVEFEMSLPLTEEEEQTSRDHLTNGSGKFCSRHFSILDYHSENDIIRGSSQSQLLASSLDRKKSLRPPPPRPKMLRPPGLSTQTPVTNGQPIYKPARQAPPPPPPPLLLRRQAATTGETLLPEEDDEEVEEEEHVQEHEDVLQRERELEQERVKDRERCGRLLRLEEVERDMEMYSNTAQELRAMLEDEGEEDEVFLQQTLENLEFCTYTLENLTQEQQRLRGKKFMTDCLISNKRWFAFKCCNSATCSPRVCVWFHPGTPVSGQVYWR